MFKKLLQSKNIDFIDNGNLKEEHLGKKWLVCCSYNPNKSNMSRHLDALRKSLDLYSAHYENTILIGDFNVSIDDPHMEYFCES